MDKPFYFRYLGRLHKSMQRQRKEIERVVVTYNNVQFDCIFDMGHNPEFLLAASGTTFARVYKIEHNSENEYVCYMPYRDYMELRSILNLNPNSAEPFSSSKFLCYIDKHLPAEASPVLVSPAIVAKARKDYISDTDYKEGFLFRRWLPHEGQNNGHVTAQNLEKTRLLLGDAISSYCAKNDVSAQWTTDPKKAGVLTNPLRNN